jgi:NADPH:quinone reductase-like Zn-dependent oxidoreductase
MKAIVCRRFGPPEVLELTELPKPVPKDREVLVRVRATTVSAADWRARSRILPKGFGLLAGAFLGFTRPRHPILGTELAGEVEAVGKSVSRFAVGDPVFAFPGIGFGCYAEYRCVPEDGAVAPKPPNLSFEEAAALTFGGTTALGFLRRAGLKAGERVLVNGASGACGTAAVQLAKHLGAEVTGVCSGANVELVRSLGADRVVDYTKEDFTRGGDRYDVIVDAVGSAPFSRSRGSLVDGGRLLAIVAALPEMLRAPWESFTSGKKIIAGSPGSRPEDLRFLAELAQAGRYRPVIDRRYRMEQMVEAHRYVDLGHKRGNVVVTLEAP